MFSRESLDKPQNFRYYPCMIIYTDGSWDNLKRGGYGWVIFAGGERRYGGASVFPAASSSEMEFIAAIAAMEFALKHMLGQKSTGRSFMYERIVMVTDVVDFPKMLPLIPEIRDRGWRTAKGVPLVNHELWERLHEVHEFVQPHWEWVSGKHNPAGQIAHRLANFYRLECPTDPNLVDAKTRKRYKRLSAQTQDYLDKP